MGNRPGPRRLKFMPLAAVFTLGRKDHIQTSLTAAPASTMAPSVRRRGCQTREGIRRYRYFVCRQAQQRGGTPALETLPRTGIGPLPVVRPISHLTSPFARLRVAAIHCSERVGSEKSRRSSLSFALAAVQFAAWAVAKRPRGCPSIVVPLSESRTSQSSHTLSGGVTWEQFAS
jgi:hypothetical protein